jgi:hypothetical protein
MKLEIGQFARLKSGYSDELGIGKIDFVANCGVATIDFKNKKLGVFTEDIIKVNYNIIDLIELGDILVDDTNRKLEVLSIDNELMVRNTGLIYDNNYYLPIKNIAIKSVITHEQMEQMAYKVGDDKK